VARLSRSRLKTQELGILRFVGSAGILPASLKLVWQHLLCYQALAGWEPALLKRCGGKPRNYTPEMLLAVWANRINVSDE
jgi:hypothetical protein